MKRLKYKPLSFEDLPLLHKWYRYPHVLKWYSKEPMTLEQIEKKYTPYILGKNGIKGFICYCDNKPFGYIQYYSVANYPWNNHELKPKLSLIAGLDTFIGETSFLGKGLGKAMIERFIRRHVWQYYAYCVVDPEVSNKKAIGCYSACGFELHKKILSDEKELHYLMVKEASFA